MYSDLKKKVLKANLDLPKHGLVTFTWGNVSEIDRKNSVVAIKPSGVDYEEMKAEHIVIVDLDGNIVEGDMKPSSDLATHLQLYKAFDNIGGVVHTHSTWATACAQAGVPIETYGTTHSDYFYGTIPCSRSMTPQEVTSQYELETGNVIVETFRNIDPTTIPSVLVKNHGPFSWGKDADGAVYNAVVLEEVAKMYVLTKLMNPIASPVSDFLLDKHFLRKHGANAYYGQN